MARRTNILWKIKEMVADEVDRIAEIDVSESGDVVYKWLDGRIVPTPEEWSRPRSYGEGWRRRAAMIKAGLAKGGIAFGAFDGDLPVGFAALQYRLADDVAVLLALWVSRKYRRQGIATALVERVTRLAKENGAEAVYVSAMPSESAQSFYRRMGFRPSEFVHRELSEREPDDIQMVKDL